MKPLERLHVYYDAVPRTAPVNIAIDEAGFLSAGAPTLRFYQWRSPSVSFGYFGEYADVSEFEGDHEIVRRWTGGGIVHHGSDVTYSFCVPAKDGYASRSSRQVYCDLHEALARVLRASGVPAVVAEAAEPKISASCFANPVKADVLVGGVKVAGAAQRRSRAGLLQQGSVQMENLPPGFREHFAAALCDNFTTSALPGKVVDDGEKLASAKYATDGWLRRR